MGREVPMNVIGSNLSELSQLPAESHAIAWLVIGSIKSQEKQYLALDAAEVGNVREQPYQVIEDSHRELTMHQKPFQDLYNQLILS